MSVYAGPGTVKSGLILDFDAANIKSYPGSGNTWNDITGSGMYCTLKNGPVYSSDVGGKISFDGTNDYALFSNNTITDNASTLTVSAWVNMNWSNAAIYHPIVTKIGDIGSGAGWELGKNQANQVMFIIQAPGGNQWNGRYCNVPGGSYWMNITGKYSSGFNGNISLYVNGVPQSLTSLGNSAISTIATNSSITLASRDGVNGYGTKNTSCNIACVQIYNRALTDAEVKQNFNATRGRFGI